MTDKIGFEYHVCHRPLMHQHPFFFLFFPKPETSLMAHGLYVLRPAGKGAGMGKEHLLRGPTPHPSVLPSLTSQPQSGPCQARSTSDDPYASQIADKGPPGGLPSLEQPSSPSSWLAEPARRSPAWDQWVQQPLVEGLEAGIGKEDVRPVEITQGSNGSSHQLRVGPLMCCWALWYLMDMHKEALRNTVPHELLP